MKGERRRTIFRKPKWGTSDRKMIHVRIDPDVYEALVDMCRSRANPEALQYGEFSERVRLALREYVTREREREQEKA